MKKLTDRFNRTHEYLRISLTDRCNFNCIYCNPNNSTYQKLLRNDILSYNELLRLISIFGSAGIKKIRFTGGEPLARNGVIDFFKQVKVYKEIFNLEIAITTNGMLLNKNVRKLKEAGIDRLNISIDSLQKGNFYRITKRDKLENVLSSVDEAQQFGFNPLKINFVAMKGINDNEIIDFVDYAIEKKLNVRFIEFMPFRNNGWQSDYFIGWEDIKSIIEEKYNLEALHSENSVAKNYIISNNPGKVSFISPISDHFCNSCNRLRITASGKLKLCLFTNGASELDFKKLLNDKNLSDRSITKLISEQLKLKKEIHAPVEELLMYEKNNMLSIGG